MYCKSLSPLSERFGRSNQSKTLCRSFSNLTLDSSFLNSNNEYFGLTALNITAFTFSFLLDCLYLEFSNLNYFSAWKLSWWRGQGRGPAHGACRRRPLTSAAPSVGSFAAERMFKSNQNNNQNGKDSETFAMPDLCKEQVIVFVYLLFGFNLWIQFLKLIESASNR